MGRPDQLLKYMLELEAPQATHDAVTFKAAPEIPTTELSPDGLLVTTTPELLTTLPAPWCLVHREVVVDGKMPGDRLDPLTVERCLWRRQARQVQRIEKEAADPAPEFAAVAPPSDAALPQPASALLRRPFLTLRRGASYSAPGERDGQRCQSRPRSLASSRAHGFGFMMLRGGYPLQSVSMTSW